MSGPRYALYVVPAHGGALYRFGAAVLGYDCYDGSDLPHPVGLGEGGEDWRTLTEEPRKYGFHGTLKAPFRLTAESDETGLIDAFDRFAQNRAVAPEFLPEVRLLGGFIAIMPQNPCPVLSALADAGVTAFDSFRAPLTDRDRERRIATGLSPEEVLNLDRWGYPYVFDRFRFHMTLTGSLPPERRDAILLQLKQAFAREHGQDRPIRVDRIALVCQPSASSRFVVLRHAQIGVAG